MISSSTPKSVTIIGASVGGLTLGLALKKYGIQPRFFELRGPDQDLGGAMSLTPNSLRVLESIGAYSRIKPQGFICEAFTFMTDPEHEITGRLYFGQKDVYGYDCLRVTRKVIIRELTEMVKEVGVEIHYGKKFTKIVHEDANGVVFEFADGTREKAEMLIGADGIHSKVRSCIFPDIHPHYSGVLGLTYCFPRANWQHLEETFPLPCSLRGKQGSWIITPQTEGGKEIFVGRQLKYEQEDRSGWDTLLKDKQAMIDMIQRDPNEWSPLVQAAQAQVSTPEAHFLNVWPFYTLKMDGWHSSTGRVVIIGDAAHAIPPSAGQGANQAFESSYSLAMLLANLNGKVSLSDALKAWEAYRMERLEDVIRLTNRVMTLRMTEEERASMPEEMRWELDGSDAGKSQLGWLFLADIDRDVKNLVKTLDERDR
ncbi:kynurenine 3-monooxygenase [Lepidopterella palustris CBS 459.81]|uniref:Kynurenine 3-monooxygenase n=1 Tax=Lepidopterella palustris CBS 459.81 TaxID=1314670 RepID=A0A8E2E122_9PEZI|nr:kynurenine 3-monooxygenase [Lepidopterella palustris CBS 459.81]